MGSQQQFCLRWNNHQSNMLTVFDNLFQNEALVDVTLACEGLSLKAHKMVLSACSPFFQSLFIDNPCKHPIVILKDVRYMDLKALVDFMYKGEVNVSQDQLNRLLKTAETLKVRGLAEVTSGYCFEENGTALTGSMAPPQAPTQNSQVAYENNTARSPQQPQMSPPRKRKKAKHRSRVEKHTSHSEHEDSDGGPEMIEPKVEITEDNFASEKNSEQATSRHNQESPRRGAEDKESGFTAGPSASSTPSTKPSQNQGSFGPLTPVGTASSDGQLSNQSLSQQNASQDLEVQLLDNGTMTHFGSISVSRLWGNESQDSFEGSLSRPRLYDYDTTDEDAELTDIGNEIMVDKRKLDLLLATTSDSPTRFVRGLLMLVFSKEELKGRSVTGRRRHSSCGGQQKDPLECGRLNAVVDYTLGVFPDTSVVRIRQTISNKLKEVNNATAVPLGGSLEVPNLGLFH